MSKELIADPSGVKPGAEGYVETFAPDPPVVKKEPDTKVDKTKQDPIPYTRFEEVNTRMKTAEKKIEDMKVDQKKIIDKKLEEDGEHAILWKDEKEAHEKTKIKADQWDVYKTDHKKVLMGQIPEKDRELYEELPLEKLEKVVGKYLKDGSLGVNVEDPSRHVDMTAEERKKLHSGTAAEKRESHEKLIDSYKNRK